MFNSTLGRFGIAFVVLAAAAWALTVDNGERVSKLLTEMGRQQVHSEAVETAMHMRDLLRGRRDQLALLAGSPFIVRALEGTGSVEDATARLDHALQTLTTADSLCLRDARGHIVASASRTPEIPCPEVDSRDGWFVARSGAVHQVLQFRMENGLGTLVGAFRPALSQSLLQEALAGSLTLRSYLVDADGRALTPAPWLNIAPGDRLARWEVAPPDRVRAQEPVGLAGVWVRSELDLSGADGPLEQSTWTSFLLISCAVVILAFVLYAMARSITLPLNEAVRSAEEIASGRFDGRVAVSGSTEVRDLARAVNQMAGKLQRLYGNLEEEVAQRSRELVEALEKARSLHKLSEAQAEELAAQNEELHSQTAELAVHQQLLHQQNDMLAEKNRALEAVNRHKDEFVANMSHELRTPLNAVIGFSELLREGIGGPLTSDQREYVDDIHGAGRHLLSMINDILDLAKIEAGRMNLELVRMDLALPLREAEQMVRPLTARRSQDFEVVITPGAMVWGDPQRLRQVALNLLSNAVKFTPPGGRIRARVRPNDAGFAELIVEDNGIGIAPENHEAIFEAFRQVDGSVTRSFDGTGLGLALVKKFVQAQGGTVQVESRLGEGARFVVRFPLAEQDAPEERENTEASTPADVLVVEDDRHARELLAKLLTARGHRVEVAVDGRAALEALKARLPQVVVLDLMLPKLDGFSVLDELRKLSGGDRVSVLVLSAKQPDGDEIQRLRSADAEVALKGALHSNEFLARVAELAAKADLRRAA